MVGGVKMGTHAIMSLIPFFVVAVHAGAAIVSDDVCSPSSSWQTDMILGANFINTSSVESAEDCCSSCEANQGCYAWTFEHPSSSGGDNCFLKDDVFFREEKLGAVSGQSRPSPYGDGSIGRACSTTDTSGFPFCNLSLSTQARVNDLIGRLSLAEKAAMLTARQSPGGDVPRLGVPEYDWGTNCIHGVQSRCTQPLTKGDATTIRCPTSFPNPIGLGGSFNRSLWRQMASVIGLELRALWCVRYLPHRTTCSDSAGHLLNGAAHIDRVYSLMHPTRSGCRALGRITSTTCPTWASIAGPRTSTSRGTRAGDASWRRPARTRC